MKLDTGIIIFKGLAHFLIGVFTPWSAALAQYISAGEWPGKIVWIGVIVPASVVGGGSALVAFLSGSFKEYREQKKADDTGEVQRLETKPSVKTNGSTN